jgi:hypothetical protein
MKFQIKKCSGEEHSITAKILVGEASAAMAVFWASTWFIPERPVVCQVITERDGIVLPLPIILKNGRRHGPACSVVLSFKSICFDSRRTPIWVMYSPTSMPLDALGLGLA